MGENSIDIERKRTTMIDAMLSKRLKTALKRKKMRQKELAARLGMDYQQLTRAMNGRRPIYAQELPRFARALEVSVESLLGMEE